MFVLGACLRVSVYACLRERECLGYVCVCMRVKARAYVCVCGGGGAWGMKDTYTNMSGNVRAISVLLQIILERVICVVKSGLTDVQVNSPIICHGSCNNAILKLTA